ncbi:MAG: beta-lactamase family protein [Flavobacteriaceae bacterium]|nr:beta-lactamase family protein [Flavobacteriaceae bacterium]
MKKQLLLSLSIIIMLSSCSWGEKTKQAKQGEEEVKQIISKYSLDEPKLDSLLAVYSDNGKYMGGIALAHDGKSIYTNSIGFNDIETKETSDINTKYRIGSISKTFTAVLVFKAIEEGKLKIEQTIEGYFPKVKNASKITIGNLLNHRSGIYNYTSDKAFRTYYTEYTPSEKLVDMISTYESDFEPNSRGAYSNSNYVLLSVILEKVYNMSLKELIQAKISIPFGLKNTYYGGKTDLSNNETNSYKYRGNKWVKEPEGDLSNAMGAGAIVSTTSDLNKFMHLLFSEKIISKKSIDMMTVISGTHGMGIFRFSISGREGFGHRGDLSGFKSVVIYFPKDKLSISLLSNGTDNNQNEIMTTALGYYFNDELIEISEADLKKYVGVYLEPKEKVKEGEEPGDFTFISDEKFLILAIGDEFKENLVYKGGNYFVFEQIYAEAIHYRFFPELNKVEYTQGNSKGVFFRE